MHKLKIIPPVEKEPDFTKLMEAFYSFSLPKVYNAKNLAIELAKRTKFLKDEVITEELAEEEKTAKDLSSDFMKHSDNSSSADFQKRILPMYIPRQSLMDFSPRA